MLNLRAKFVIQQAATREATMHVLLTGGSGFIGQAFAKRLLNANSLNVSGEDAGGITRLTVIDTVPAPTPSDDQRVSAVQGDITDRSSLNELITEPVDLCVHLAAIVSANAEADFDLGWSVNVDGTRNLLELMRTQANRPKFVFASSLAVFGGDMPELVSDQIALWPQTSYGAQKAVSELMVADYARKGFVDGLSLRLPTVVVRPGKPNKAASTFASSIIREPLAGKPAICPVDPSAEMFITSPRNIVASLFHAIALADEKIGPNKGMVLPGITVAIGDMVAALRDVAGNDVADLVRWQPDPVIQKIVAGWAANVSGARALKLGFPQDQDFASIIRAHIDDYVAA